jgi:uncharacterized protein involved in oxidation of intracellular sulfur
MALNPSFLKGLKCAKDICVELFPELLHKTFLEPHQHSLKFTEGGRSVPEKEKIIYITTHAGEDPERASLPLVLANAAQAMEVDALVVLQGTGVYLAKKGYVEHVHAAGLAPLKELLDNFVEAGGKLLVCVPCMQQRNINESDLIEGAEPTAAGSLTMEILSAKATLVY